MFLLNALKKQIDVILFILFNLIVFSFITNNVETDIEEHLQHIVNINANVTNYPPNFLFYYLANILSLFSSNLKLLYWSTILLLSTSNTLRFYISKLIIKKLSKNNGFKLKPFQLTVLGLLLFICFGIPDYFNLFEFKKLYITRIVSNVWHNSTLILLFPFAFLLFFKQYQVLENPLKSKHLDLVIITFLVLINIIIKPSFVFVYIPVTLIFLLKIMLSLGFRKIAYLFLPIILGSLFLLIQYLMIYKFQIGSIQSDEVSQVIIVKPFKYYLYWMPDWYLPIMFLFSYTLPFFSIILKPKILKYKPFLYALCMSIFGLLISIFVMESGPRQWHGNFMWQNIICSSLLFLTNVIFLNTYYLKKNNMSAKLKFLIGIFMLHCVSGVIYLFKIYHTHMYI